MRRGYTTTEFGIAVAWWSLTAFAVIAVSRLPWPQSLFMACVAGALAYFSCALSNNYGENRYLLKSEKRQQEQGVEAGEPRQTFGFGRYVAREQSEETEDEE